MTVRGRRYAHDSLHDQSACKSSDPVPCFGIFLFFISRTLNDQRLYGEAVGSSSPENRGRSVYDKVRYTTKAKRVLAFDFQLLLPLAWLRTTRFSTSMDIDDVPLENIFDLPTPPRPARPSNANPLFLQSPSVAGGSPPPPAARNNSYQQRPGGGDGARRNLASAMSLFDDLDEEDDAVIPGRENPGEGLAGGAGAAAGEEAKEGEEAGKEKGKRTIAKIDAPRLVHPTRRRRVERKASRTSTN
jgi:hypothetical protein